MLLAKHSLSLRQPPNIAFTHQGHDIRSSTSSTSQLDVASFRQQTAVGTNIDERVSFTHITHHHDEI